MLSTVFKEPVLFTYLKSMGSKINHNFVLNARNKNAYNVQNTNTSLLRIYITIHEAMGHKYIQLLWLLINLKQFNPSNSNTLSQLYKNIVF